MRDTNYDARHQIIHESVVLVVCLFLHSHTVSSLTCEESKGSKIKHAASVKRKILSLFHVKGADGAPRNVRSIKSTTWVANSVSALPLRMAEDMKSIHVFHAKIRAKDH